MMLDEHGTHKLISVIVKQAVSDWRNSMRRLRRSPNNIDANMMVIDCERFFLSGYFTLLTDLDSERFLYKLAKKTGFDN